MASVANHHRRSQPVGKIGEALVVGRGAGLASSLPHLLWRSGLAVDVITTSRLVRLSRFARRVQLAGSISEIAECARAGIESRPYDWVIATEDDSLRALARLDWSPGKRPAHLPIWTGKYRRHLYSKIGLSRVLSAGGMKTPPFHATGDCAEAVSAARQLGYPVFLKLDASGGGVGVFECRQDSDIIALAGLFTNGPLLVQKKIDGIQVDLSAIYLDEQLVHFAYSTIERSVSRFGVSVLRAYYPLSRVAPDVFAELAALGHITGASGFVNISTIDAADGSGRYYIEADMRPNVWVDFSRFYGEDAAPRIRNWFSRGAGLTWENAGVAASPPAPMIIPYFLRLRLPELLVNRYHVWRFIPWAEGPLVGSLLLAKAARDVGKALVPQKLRRGIRDRLGRVGILSE